IQAEMAAWEDVHPGEQIPPATLAHMLSKITDEDGIHYSSLNPAKNLLPDDLVVPHKVYEQFESPAQMTMAMRALARTNRGFKTWVLPFSGRWQVGNAIGNVLQAAMHAGVGPVELARYARQIVKEQGGFRQVWQNEGLTPDT